MAIAKKEFKRGQRVDAFNNRGAKLGHGTVKSATETVKGFWYDVKLDATDAVKRLRAGQLIAL